jgi:hypothetical protein
MDAKHPGRSRHCGSRRRQAMDAGLPAVLAFAPPASPKNALLVGRHRAEPVSGRIENRLRGGGLVLPSLRMEGGGQ